MPNPAPRRPQPGVPNDQPAGGSDADAPPSSDTNDAPPRFSPTLNVNRKLDEIRIDYVEIEHQDRESTGTVTVIYRSNGRCSPSLYHLVNEYGAAAAG